MQFEEQFSSGKIFLMEGALGERLKYEYNLMPDTYLALAKHVYEQSGREALWNLWLEYDEIAANYNIPFLALTPTRRVNVERAKLGKIGAEVVLYNVAFLQSVQRECKAQAFVGGMVGCKGDAYTGEDALKEEEAAIFHKWEVELFEQAGVDFLYAALIPTLGEAAGLAAAMAETQLPYIVSFNMRRDGTLLDGTTISEAIEYIDKTVKRQPLCYMANCVHPRIVYEALSQECNKNPMVRKRFLGIQGNTSLLPYVRPGYARNLLEAEPVEFAKEMLRLRDIADIQIFGGCCGTDGRHMKEIAARIA